MSRPVCILMVKAPRAGEVKTRLVPPLSHAEAATLAASFAQDMVMKVLSIGCDVIVAYAPSNGCASLAALLPSDDLIWLEQQGADLGARLETATAHAASLGYSPIIVTGTDSPSLPKSYIERAVLSLAAEESDIALGPTEDGGYYLVGLRESAGNLFQNIAWSSSLAYRQTLDNAARLNLRAFELPRWYDIDTCSDLVRLRDEIFTSEEARMLAPVTSRWLDAHASLLPTLA